MAGGGAGGAAERCIVDAGGGGPPGAEWVGGWGEEGAAGGGAPVNRPRACRADHPPYAQASIQKINLQNNLRDFIQHLRIRDIW